MSDETASSSSQSPAAKKKKKKESLGWMDWMRGWSSVFGEILFQRITASHLLNPLSLPPLNHLTCLVTGSTSGIGRQTARQLAEGGAHVVMAVRNTKAAQEMIQQWQNEWSGKGLPLNIEAMELDLLSLDSVARFAHAWNARLGPLHVLINNAGIFAMGEAQKFSEDGYEQHMQVNHLAPSLLSVLLLPSLIRGSPSRIINVNSVMHSVGFVDPDDMNVVSGSRKYSSVVGYSSSKLAQIMFSSILFKKLPLETGVSVICLSPGVVLTNVARDLPRFLQALYAVIPYFIFSPQEGCRCSLFSATDPQIPEYWETLKNDDWPVCPFISQDCRPTNPSEEAHNTETSHRVWEKTLELVGLSLDAVEKLVEGESVKCRYGSQDE
ncbi:NAD(P)-binding Rossmann-fold superfamily protein [Raphanus sativus]|uniref:Dehydrogenase/reductase SDR family member FEY-like n=1 Tax=Raphanus sativus TaxID=3726 RepID=A0A9W3CTU1_RAPSA|nr:dehydrogenase/reductase SDR family member FEY-like [Raphanus sativus]KAJ4869390.1 NAD(P)-binding Rossmann-fold superfamily protein [Raphanus sativus]